MLKIFTLLTLVFAINSQAEAAATKFSCGNVGNEEEWTIYVDLSKKLAGFFDNDTTETLPLSKMRLIETYPSQTVYEFQEKNSETVIYFNKTKLTASVSFRESATDKLTSYEAINGCKIDNSVDLE